MKSNGLMRTLKARSPAQSGQMQYTSIIPDIVYTSNYNKISILYKCNCRVGEPATTAAAVVGVEASAEKSHESVESSLQRSLGRGATPAKRLYALGFSYQVLVEIRQSTATSDDFQRVF